MKRVDMVRKCFHWITTEGTVEQNMINDVDKEGIMFRAQGEII